MADIKFPEGIRIYKPNEKAPTFVKGEIEINKFDLMAWLDSQKGDKIKLTISESQKGSWYLKVNDFVPTAKVEPIAPQKIETLTETLSKDDLPF